MKKQFYILALCLAFATTESALSQSISGFGTGDFTMSYSEFTYTQAATSLNITGIDNYQFAGGITPLTISIPTQLSLTGTLTTGSNTLFSIGLQDASFNQVWYTGSWSAFTAGIEQTIILNQTSVSGGALGAITGIAMTTGGLGSGSINFTFNELSAVPEPSVMMLVGAAMSGLALCRAARRKI